MLLEVRQALLGGGRKDREQASRESLGSGNVLFLDFMTLWFAKFHGVYSSLCVYSSLIKRVSWNKQTKTPMCAAYCKIQMCGSQSGTHGGLCHTTNVQLLSQPVKCRN